MRHFLLDYPKTGSKHTSQGQKAEGTLELCVH